MFLIRTAFWLALVVAFIPVNPADLGDGQRPVSTQETIGAAQALISDIAGFCQRNGSACETGREVFSQFGAKARAGLRYASAYFDEEDAPSPDEAGASDEIRVGAVD